MFIKNGSSNREHYEKLNAVILQGKKNAECACNAALRLVHSALKLSGDFISAGRNAGASVVLTPLSKLLLGVNSRSGRPDHLLNISRYLLIMISSMLLNFLFFCLFSLFPNRSKNTNVYRLGTWCTGPGCRWAGSTPSRSSTTSQAHPQTRNETFFCCCCKYMKPYFSVSSVLYW